MDIKNIYDLEKAGNELYKALAKKFVKTIEIMEESILNKTYVLDIERNLLECHLSVILELCKDIGVDWLGEIKYNEENKPFIYSNDYDKLLNQIKDLKFYTEFQIKDCIRGKA